MRKTLFILLIFPLFFACNSDDKPNLKGTKWFYVATTPDGKYYWEDILDFTSESECTWTIATNIHESDYGYGYEPYDPIPSRFRYTLSVLNLNLYNKDTDDNLQATIDVQTKSITISHRIFIRK